jgi:hypothetical protein
MSLTSQVTQSSAAVVDFATVSNIKPRRPAQRISHPDAELIENCIAYAVTVTGISAAFKVDPTDAKFAEVTLKKADRRAERLMGEILALPAKTVDGARAKTALVDIVLYHFEGCAIDGLHLDFISSIAKDVAIVQQAASALKQSDTVLVVPK